MELSEESAVNQEKKKEGEREDGRKKTLLLTTSPFSWVFSLLLCYFSSAFTVRQAG